MERMVFHKKTVCKRDRTLAAGCGDAGLGAEEGRVEGKYE
jgi:hypothetical protein